MSFFSNLFSGIANVLGIGDANRIPVEQLEIIHERAEELKQERQGIKSKPPLKKGKSQGAEELKCENTQTTKEKKAFLKRSQGQVAACQKRQIIGLKEQSLKTEDEKLAELKYIESIKNSNIVPSTLRDDYRGQRQKKESKSARSSSVRNSELNLAASQLRMSKIVNQVQDDQKDQKRKPKKTASQHAIKSVQKNRQIRHEKSPDNSMSMKYETCNLRRSRRSSPQLLKIPLSSSTCRPSFFHVDSSEESIPDETQTVSMKDSMRHSRMNSPESLQYFPSQSSQFNFVPKFYKAMEPGATAEEGVKQTQRQSMIGNSGLKFDLDKMYTDSAMKKAFATSRKLDRNESSDLVKMSGAKSKKKVTFNLDQDIEPIDKSTSTYRKTSD